MVRCGRHSPHSLPARAIWSIDPWSYGSVPLWLVSFGTVPRPLVPFRIYFDPSGSNRSVSAVCIQAPDLSETSPPGLPEAPLGPSGEGRAPGRVRLAPPDYRTRPECAYLPEVAGFSRPTPMPTARGPHSKETAGSLTCEHPWPSTMLVRVPSGRQPIIDLSMYSSILMGRGIGVGRLARQVRGE